MNAKKNQVSVCRYNEDIQEMDRQHPGRYEKYELTADMTEDRQYWKMMVKTGPQRCGDGRERDSGYHS